MTRVLEAIYEKGVLKPLEDPCLAEHQRVVLELHEPPAEDSDQRLAAWHQVYMRACRTIRSPTSRPLRSTAPPKARRSSSMEDPPGPE